MRAHTQVFRSIKLTVIGAWLLGGTMCLTAVPVITMEDELTGKLLSWDGSEGEGLDYVLMGSDDGETWAPLGLSVMQPGGTGPYQVSVPTNLARKFYRLEDDGISTNNEATKAYVGADRCKNCHNSKHADWADGGHPHKLNKVVGNDPPEYFSTNTVNVPTPPQGVSWSDVSYVIGGAIWKARFIGQDGYIITGTADDTDLVQYNLQDGSWALYHRDEMKPYNCGSCHTTGWVSTADGSVNQDGMPGMHGSFAASAIECEACHGPGSRHERPGLSAPQRRAEINIDTSAAMCGSCHVRGAINTIPASGGFIRHHEQYNEMLAAGHSGHECVTCHEPHKSVKVGAMDGIKTEGACTYCHNANSPAPGTIAHDFAANQHDGNATCVDCHMARASKSAIKQPGNDHVGDIQTHIFKINPGSDRSDVAMFETDGEGKQWVILDASDQSAGVTLDFVCYKCHGDPDNTTNAPEEEFSMLELSGTATNYHGVNP